MIAVPKHASTVVLIDDQSRIYLTKRPETMKFMGGFYVFPGGSMDEADHVVKDSNIDASHQHEDLMKAHYITAARELFEEIGILLGEQMDGSPIVLSEEKALTYRQQLLKHEIRFGEILEREKIFFDFSKLTYFGQLITPKKSPIRFDTRFFLAKLPQGQEPIPDTSEIADAFWIAPEEALDRFEKNQLKFSAPTLLSIEAVIKYLNGGTLHISASEKELLKIRRNIM